jgi:hypothetical protein
MNKRGTERVKEEVRTKLLFSQRQPKTQATIQPKSASKNPFALITVL